MNFQTFRPVGGHCIGIDPYYLTHKARELRRRHESITAGRQINDDMGAHVATRVIDLISELIDLDSLAA